jgi:exopolyphosphatase/guanosine-5'-triphosphate,3'-diphosphate pyrophosphatase
MPAAVVAALDCGTNSTRLLIVDGDGNALVREMRITRLGQGVDATHALAPEAMERTLEVLRTYRRLMDEANVQNARLVATSAVRDAANGEEFLQAATAAVGTAAELLSGLDEGRLSHAGAIRGLAPGVGDDVVVDIGGGSTELIVARNRVIHAVSMDLGCVRLSERSLRHDPPQPSEIADVDAIVATALDAAYQVVPDLATLPPGSRLIGLAGTVSTLMALELGLVDYDRAKVHHATLTLTAVRKWC